MRCTLLVLLLSAATLGFGQAGPSFPFTSQPLGQMLSPQSPSFGSTPGRDFSKLPEWKWDPSLPSLQSRTVLLPPPQQTVVPLGDAQIDPQIVHHPSSKDLGAQPASTQIAQNLFPGLTFQPIDASLWQLCASQPKPLSTVWPALKVKRIPTDWPNLRTNLVGEPDQGSSTEAPSARK